MSRVLLTFPADVALAQRVAPLVDARISMLDWHRFPDGESMLTLEPTFDGADVAVLASQRDPDAIALPLRFAADTARELGARSVGLVAPYLAYMRQDARFAPGQAVSAPIFARFLEQTVDWLVTVDPHLHRILRLGDVYRMPAEHVSATPAVARWIASNVAEAVLIGPDSESAQWVAAIAAAAGVPFQVLQKTRRGDRDVEVSLPDAGAVAHRMPVLVDDIVSSGHTIEATLGHLSRLGLPSPVVIAIHAVFAGDAYARIGAAGASRVVSTDTIAHPSNVISVAAEIAVAVDRMFGCMRETAAI